MRDSKSSEKKPVQEVQAPRKHDVKLEPVICDTTERKRSEDALLSERNNMLSAFEAMEDGVYIVNQQYDIQYVNPVIEKDFGPWQGCKCYQYFHDRKKTCPWCKNEQVFAGETVRWEWYSSKNRKTYDLIDTPLKNPDGSISKLEIFRDITERKKMEEQLEQSREFLANTINALDDSFFVKDEEHKWTIFNDAACKSIGRPRGELIGKSDYDIFPKEQADVFWEKDNLVFETGETSINEEEVTWKGKLHTISTKKSLFKDSITGKRFIVGTVRDITERKQIEKTLRESEQKYRALVEQSLHGIVILQDYRIVFANKAATEIAGLTIDEAQSLSLEDMMAFIPPENRAATLERLKNRFARKNEPGNYELRLVRRNGEEFWVNLFFSNIEYQGEFAIQLAFVDITDQKRMEEALRQSEIQFREIFENTPVGVYRTTPDGRVLMANPALVHMLRFSSFEELSQRNLEEEGFEPQYRRSMFREEIERKGRIDGWESIWITREGKKLNVIENARVVQDEDGKILYYEGTAENITERKQAEEKLRVREQTLRAFLNAPTESAILVNTEGTILDINRIAAQRLGKSAEELIGMGIYDYLPADIAKSRKARGAEVIRSGKPLRFQDEREGRHYDNNVYPVFDDEGRISALAVFSGDITENKRAEERLLEYQEQLKSLASELTLAEERERHRIATDLHDEISQSLFISKMKLEALHKSASGKKSDDTLDEISNSLGEIIAAMRSLTFDLSSPILYEFGFEEAVAEWLNERVEKKYGIATEFEDDGLPKPLGDDIRVLLFRNVRELLINVVKHAHASKVKVSIGKVGVRIRISVEDDGLGFDTSKADTMITNKEAFGLFSIRERLEHFGGTLEIKSSPGCGCRVTIMSPLKQENIHKDKHK